MDYLKALRDAPDLAEEFDSLFDFFLLDELSPRDDAEGRYTFSLPGMAFARDGSGGEYHLLEDGTIGYNGSEGQAGRLAESMDDLFSLIVNCICWQDCCNAKEYVDSRTLEEYGQRQRNCNLEDILSAFLSMYLWLRFWIDFERRRSGNLCISVFSMRTMEA